MQPQLQTTGIHHITAVATSAADNFNFYRNILGLRLVKKTVNFDDPSTYHLYYADPDGEPGTILTFFPWENMPSGRPGAGMVTAVAFAVPEAAMAYWADRLATLGIEARETHRFGEPLLSFSDPHGLPLEIVGAAEAPLSKPWRQQSLPQQHAIVGFHSATSLVHGMDQVNDLLTEAMGMTLIGAEGQRHRYRAGGKVGTGVFYEVVDDPGAHRGVPGGGTVHHIAFRARDDDEQLLWRDVLIGKGLSVTPVRDRNYFRSIYFNSPGGVLFEIATDPPGFAVDEPADRLGESLQLPAQFEVGRTRISAGLPSLVSDDTPHIFMPARQGADTRRTFVTFHGTGGNEHDLVDFVRTIDRASAIISPRGRVMENGMNRFFKRVGENVFDEADVVRRANELANFLVSACAHYQCSPDGLIALGYSNGANMAAAMLLLRPELFAKAILLRPMLPLQNAAPPDLSGKEILVLAGRNDTVIPAAGTRELIRRLRMGMARVEVHTLQADHGLTRGDLGAAANWLNAARRPGHDRILPAAAAERVS